MPETFCVNDMSIKCVQGKVFRVWHGYRYRSSCTVLPPPEFCLAFDTYMSSITETGCQQRSGDQHFLQSSAERFLVCGSLIVVFSQRSQDIRSGTYVRMLLRVASLETRRCSRPARELAARPRGGLPGALGVLRARRPLRRRVPRLRGKRGPAGSRGHPSWRVPVQEMQGLPFGVRPLGNQSLLGS